jgi:hypothetical protein
MPDDRANVYRQSARAARERAKAAVNPKRWLHIADAWERLARHVELNSPAWSNDWIELLEGNEQPRVGPQSSAAPR